MSIWFTSKWRKSCLIWHFCNLRSLHGPIVVNCACILSHAELFIVLLWKQTLCPIDICQICRYIDIENRDREHYNKIIFSRDGGNEVCALTYPLITNGIDPLSFIRDSAFDHFVYNGVYVLSRRTRRFILIPLIKKVAYVTVCINYMHATMAINLVKSSDKNE